MQIACTGYSIWTANKKNAASRILLSPHVNRGVFLESAYFDFYSERSGCGIILDIEIRQSEDQDSVSSMDALMIDYERTAKAMVVAETPEEKKRREEKKQKLSPPKS
jgi:hypothetical protein